MQHLSRRNHPNSFANTFRSQQHPSSTISIVSVGPTQHCPRVHRDGQHPVSHGGQHDPHGGQHDPHG